MTQPNFAQEYNYSTPPLLKFRINRKNLIANATRHGILELSETAAANAVKPAVVPELR